MAKSKQRRPRKQAATTSSTLSSPLAIGAIGALVAGGGVALATMLRRIRRPSGGHAAPDLAAGEPHPGPDHRAPDAFRPDPTAPVPRRERDGLRPATLGPIHGVAPS